MTTGNHDTLVYRLTQILVKLNQGEKLEPLKLAEEFGVNLRTIQRDLNVRFAYLPLKKIYGHYHLDPVFLGKLNTRDIERFAGLAGVHGLFPTLSNDFLRDIFDSRTQSAFLVKGHNYESLFGKEKIFRELEKAIVTRHHVGFGYEKDDGNKFHPTVAPLKLINHKGIWYLAAREVCKVKTFLFSKIKHLSLLDTRFAHDPEVEKMLTEEDGIWLSEEKIEIIFNISREVAGYFKRRKLIANQVIEKELEDGTLIVSAKVGHSTQVVPIVRYWIPHVRIISPESLQAEVENGLRNYVDRVDNQLLEMEKPEWEHYPFLHIKPFFRDIAVQHRIEGVVVEGAAQSEHGIAVFFQPPSTRALQPHMTDVLVG